MRERRTSAARRRVGADLGPDDARALLHAWLEAIDLRLGERELLALLQHEDFSHADLFRRARRAHERKLAGAVDGVLAATTTGGDLGAAAAGLFDACVAAIPYAPAAAFLGREKGKLVQREGDPLRVALVADAVGGMHGVTHTLDEIRERGRARLRGRGRRHRRQRRPPAERRGRGRHPLLRRPEGRRAVAAGDRRGAGRGSLRPRPPLQPGPRRRRRRGHRPRHGGAGARLLPHRAGGLRGAARRRPEARVHRARRDRRLLRAVPGRPEPQPRLRRGPARHGDRRRADRALGPRRRRRALLAGQARRGRACPASSASSTRAG